MQNPWTEMTLEELWALFPIQLKQHEPAYFEWYAAARGQLLQILGTQGIRRISHIGSTAVKGLLAKPIVDILLEMEPAYAVDGLAEQLGQSGWILMSQTQLPVWKLSFNYGYTLEGFAQKVFHLHVRFSGDWDELYFRDYLIAHPEAAQAYGALKVRLKEQFEHDRDGYTQAKTAFVRQYTVLAREEFKGRYMPGDSAGDTM